MDTLTLLEELLKKSTEEIDYAILYLLVKNKIDFAKLSTQYVKALEIKNTDNENKLIEAESIMMESFHDKITANKNNKSGYKHTLRTLYFLNQGKRFNLEKMNSDFDYKEEEAKKLSWYERNKEIRF